eukprot:scaffold282785_cov26-Tisochrysis_lutea.AAC.2
MDFHARKGPGPSTSPTLSALSTTAPYLAQGSLNAVPWSPPHHSIVSLPNMIAGNLRAIFLATLELSSCTAMPSLEKERAL